MRSCHYYHLAMIRRISKGLLISSHSGLMDWSALQDRMSTAPARIGGYGDHGRALEIRAPAHVIVINPKATYRVDRDQLLSNSRNTPFHGMEFDAQVIATFFHGRPVFENGRTA